MSEPLFSIIIPSLNEERYIGNILKSLSEQSCKDFEVIVVDASSTDKTSQIINNFKKNYPSRTIHSKIKNLSHQRNLGAGEAKGKYLFFIDADNNIPKDFLTITKNLLEKEKADAIIPKLIPDNNNLLNRLFYPISLFLIFVFLKTPRPFSTGGNILISSDFFKETKGFDEKVFIGEDHDMIRQLKELKGKIALMSKTYIVFSTRRFEAEGFHTYLKYAYSFIYQIIFRKINKHIYSYKMGGDNYK